MATEDDLLNAIWAPRGTPALIGHADAEEAFLAQLRARRLHHAWLIAGPNGSGKATFAYQCARFLFHHRQDAIEAADSVDGLKTPDGSAAVAKVMAGSHPDLLLLARRWDQENKRVTAGIPVDDVRRLTSFLGTTAGEGGWRVVIVDKVDDMNDSAANALLKSLEEPPASTVFFILTDYPQRILPTIRSRCRKLTFPNLTYTELRSILDEQDVQVSDEELADLAEIADYSAGRLLELSDTDQSALRSDMADRIAEQPHTDVLQQHQLADQLSGRGKERLFDEFFERTLRYVHQQAKAHATQFASTNPNPWLDAWRQIHETKGIASAYNLDKKQLILGTFALLNNAKKQMNALQ